MNEWIPISKSQIEGHLRYEITLKGVADPKNSVCVVHGVQIEPQNTLAVRLYDPEPYKEPIDPGEGWRLLDEYEIIKDGDEYARQLTEGWSTGVIAGPTPKDTGYVYRRRVEATYRPFKDDKEYAPYRHRWILHDGGDVVRVLSYDSIGIKFPGNVYMRYVTWEDAFKLLKFSDGTPFGVKIDE